MSGIDAQRDCDNPYRDDHLIRWEAWPCGCRQRARISPRACGTSCRSRRRRCLSPARRCGLVIVDEQNGFATVGAGALAPTEPNAQIARMVEETDRLARLFVERGLPIVVFLDYHQPDRPEPPYPPHCIAGSGEEELVPELQWLAEAPRATLMRADCINDFVGCIDPADRAQPDRRLGQRSSPGHDRRRRHLHRHLRRRIRRDDAVGAQPPNDADAEGRRRLRAGLRHLRPAEGEGRRPRPAGDGGASAGCSRITSGST